MSEMRPDSPRYRLDSASHERLRQQILRHDGWRCHPVARCRPWKSTINSFGVSQATIPSAISLPSAPRATSVFIVFRSWSRAITLTRRGAPVMPGAGAGGGPNWDVSPMKMGHLGTCLSVGEARGHACTSLILRNENGRVSADPPTVPSNDIALENGFAAVALCP